MDYSIMLAGHVRSGADVAVGCIDVALADGVNFGVMAVDDSGRVQAFEEKPRPWDDPRRCLASMGIYVFSVALLCEELQRDAVVAESSHDFGKDILPRLVQRRRARAHHVHAAFGISVGKHPHWRDVGTLDAF
jgi:glucose-1-phosphate adenylyltransferase